MDNLLAKLDRAFNPRTLAVVGDNAKTDYLWLRAMSAFRGKKYFVQTSKEDWPTGQKLGFECYRSILDIPGPVDYAMLSVPRKAALEVVAQCIQKDVGGVALFTAGFAEINTPEGIESQKRMADMAQQAGLVLIGPNCMGIYNRRLGVRQNSDQPVGDGGEVGMISQSGTHAVLLGISGARYGIRLSKSVSYGNAIVLDSPDYLEYLAQDPETRAIAMYIEGAKDGRRFFEVLKRAARVKPVLVWKGGRTEDGSRAAASHTAVLAQSPKIWKAVIKQCGAIEVGNLDSLLDTLNVLLHCKPVKGNNLALLAMSGGQSVAIADAFTEAGFRVPPLTEASYRKLASFFDVIGGSYQNPFDVSWNITTEALMGMLEVAGQDDNIDTIVLELGLRFLSLRWRDNYAERLAAFFGAISELKARSPKPILVIANPVNREGEAMDAIAKLAERGIPGLWGFERGAAALRKVTDYYEWWRREDGRE